MSIGRRVILLFVICSCAVALAAIGVTVVRRVVEDTLTTDAHERALQSSWAIALDRQAGAVIDLVTAQLARPDIQPAGVLATLSGVGVRSITFYDDLAQMIGVWPATEQVADIPARRVAQAIAGGRGFHTLVASGGSIYMVAVGPLQRQGDGKGAFAAKVELSLPLAETVGALGGAGYVIDPDGKLLSSYGALPWAEVSADFAGRTSNVFDLTHDTQRLRLQSITLRQPGGTALGYLVVLRDITTYDRVLNVMDLLSLTAIVAVCIAVVAFGRWFAAGSLRPLATAADGLSTLVAGNTNVDVPGAERNDEAGQLARAVVAFRDRVRQSRQGEAQRARQWSRQQEFIRAQMMRMAETLSADGRRTLEEDLARIEALAVGGPDGKEGGSKAGGDAALTAAVEVMAQRVSEQHRELDRLVNELRAALGTRTELFQLQQQMEVARSMQQAMLPRGLLPNPHIEVKGRLVPAAELDGAFFDYFWIDEERLGLTLGQPAVGGLVGGFQSGTARASMRALLLAGLDAGEALTRTRAELRAEENGEDFALTAAIIEPGTGNLVWASHAMAPPIAVRRLGDAAELSGTAIQDVDYDGDGTTDEHRFELPRRSAVMFYAPGVAQNVGPAVAPGRLLSGLRAADDISVDSLLAALQSEGLLDPGAVGNVRDGVCVIARFLA
ncbi:PP2C family protein-serine/threonine phosphatase [Radicibacter daui]|uniref:PP2C family protein-serine/threonine phosphatase n=1 Tax=Radicibacter daui TaxID=3064829 RepID=UPI00404693DF